MLANLVEKAKATTKKWWKWILGGLIALGVFFVAWKLSKQAKEIIRLKAELMLQQEKAADLDLQIKNAANTQLVYTLRARAEQAVADAAVLAMELGKKKKEYEERKALVEAAQNWNDLEAQAGGTK